jgi:xanthine dehydrogenase YagS FAD-binding subunit
MLPNFTYVRPTSLAQAIRELGAPEARVHAGGTDLLGCLRDGVFSAQKLVSLNGLAELRGISTAPGGGLRIGALTPLAEVAAHPAIVKSYAALAEAAAAVASPQLRNQGTLGGNLCQRPRCWYFRGDFHCLRKGGDTCFAAEGENEYHCIFGGSGCYAVHPSDTAPALIALDAGARIAGPKGTRTVPLAAFFTGPVDELTRETVLAPDEILTEILLPAAPAGLRSFYRKARVRAAFDFALAGAAVAVRTSPQGHVEWARVVLSGVAPVPWRAVAAEKALVAKTLDPATIRLAGTAATEGAEPLAQNGYKVDLVRGVVEEALAAIA